MEYTLSLGRYLNFRHIVEELSDIRQRYMKNHGVLLADAIDEHVTGYISK